MSTFKELFLNFEVLKEDSKIELKQLERAIKSYKQKNNNFSIRRYKDETNVIELQLNKDIFVNKKRDETYYLHFKDELKGPHNYLRNIVSQDILNNLAGGDIICKKENGFKNNSISSKVSPSSNIKKLLDNVFNSLVYDGYLYKDGKLANGETDYKKII